MCMCVLLRAFFILSLPPRPLTAPMTDLHHLLKTSKGIRLRNLP